MDERREQPTMEPANALNVADEKSAESDVGSQGQLGKFKDAMALLEAYNNLEAEFTRKCQLLKSLQQDKIDKENTQKTDTSQEKQTDFQENNEKTAKNHENHVENNKLSQDEGFSSEEQTIGQGDNNQEDYLSHLSQFLEENVLAKDYADEIKSYLEGNRIKNPYEDAWANVILNHIKVKQSDPLISQYVLNNDEVKNKIIENYLDELQKQKPPYIISSQGGQRVSGVLPDSPKTLDEAKKILNNMFS